jgi:hypothetical protein
MSIDVLALANKAAETEDQSKETAGFEKKMPVAGLRGCRFIEYIELGKHASKPGKFGAKPPADRVRLTFELLGKNDLEDLKIGEEIKKVGKRMSITVNKTLSAKGDFKKIMNLLDRGRGKQHMAQMLGEAFKVRVTLSAEDGSICTPENKKEPKWANLYSGTVDAKNWSFEAPTHEDPETGEVKQLRVLSPTSELKIFLWDNPTLATWESLFIDGTREVKAEDGTVKQESKNFIQEMCLKAANFEGSALQALVLQLATESKEFADKAAALTGDEDPLADMDALDGAPF